ncbi:thermonuclease [bacterium c-19]|nr:thermonuclease [bacterium c-19]
MKKILILFLMIVCSTLTIAANTRIEVKFKKCTDGDTAHFLIHGADTTVRFLAIDTPEYTKEKEPFGKEASEFTCQALKNANVIELEYDDGSDKSDKYGRDLAWVYVDGELLQKQLVSAGLAEVQYIYGDYAYTDELYEAQELAKQNKLNMWSGETDEAGALLATIVTAVGAGAILLLTVFNVKGKQKKIRAVKTFTKTITKR